MASRLGVARLTARGDSKLVVMQVAGRWQVNKEHLQVLHAEAVAESRKFTQFSIEHVLRYVVFRGRELGTWGSETGRAPARWAAMCCGANDRDRRVMYCTMHEYGCTVYGVLGFLHPSARIAC